MTEYYANTQTGEVVLAYESEGQMLAKPQTGIYRPGVEKEKFMAEHVELNPQPCSFNLKQEDGTVVVRSF